MENASKALIIAGSILLAVLIVALGVRIFNKAESSVDTSSLDEQEILMFNRKWENYEGEQLGSNVKSLISTVIANSNTNKEEQYKLPTIVHKAKNGTVKTTINGGKTATGSANTTYINNMSSLRKNIVSTKMYKVECTYASNGIINKITIQETE